MIGRRLAGWAVVAVVAITAGLGLLPGVASAHSLASSAVTIELSERGMTGQVALAVGSLDRAFAADRRSDVLAADDYAAQVTAYLEEHLTIRGADGVPWPEHVTSLDRRTVEGIETIGVDLTVDVGDDDPADFAITYDAIIDAVPEHEAVLVLVDAGNRASTPGVFTGAHDSIVIGAGSTEVGVTDMARLGFHHVLDGADHLLFLCTLLLPAPLVVASGRWHRGAGARSSVRKVLHVVTAFTIGHSSTLIATSLGWITVPGRPVEILIAVSVAVSAVHAIRPLVRGGEAVIAATFGLIHGMAFAGILADLGLDGSTSLVALLAFNVGIELAQLAATACIFPSLHLLSTRSSYATVRTGGASIALVAAGGWLLERLGLIANPFEGVEHALIEHPWSVVVAVALLAVAIRTFDRRRVAPGPLRSHGPAPRAARGDHVLAASAVG